ncbi:MAG TPA: patatin-like protein [Actinomycetota bacterium]|nr:patatin-like protein [Actinomycetota bacterium]
MSDQIHGALGVQRELRLGLVCYGGVSLAIYMHGQTKELHRLVKASVDGTGGVKTPSQKVYADLIDEMHREDGEGARTRVVVDIIAGTSAGGINGIYLAKALAHDLSQDLLRDLWFERGDIKQLLAGPSFIPPAVKAPFLLARLRKATPLRGDQMSIWLHGALAGMDKTGQEGKSLVPDDGLLQLFVTVTDFYGYNSKVAIGDPRLISDQRHRHMLTFRYRSRRIDQFSDASNLPLAFAARTTSSFPGAFPPVSFKAFMGYFDRKVDLIDFERRYFRSYQLSKARPADTFFIDGGVLDNKPFGHVVSAIRKRPAETEVNRKLLYLEPDPGTHQRPPTGDEPSPLSTVLGSLSGIPKNEPILDELIEIAEFNNYVGRIRDIIETSFDRIGARVEEIVGEPLAKLPSDPTGEALSSWQQRLNEEAAKDAGFNFATYIRMKITGVVDRFAEMVCNACDYPATSNHAFATRSVLRTWAAREGLFDRSVEVLPQQLDFLKSFDLGFGERRLRFVVAAFNWWYRDVGQPGFPSRSELDEGKSRVYQAIAHLSNAADDVAMEDGLRKLILACFGESAIEGVLNVDPKNVEEFVISRSDELSKIADAMRAGLNQKLAGFSLGLYKEIRVVTVKWHEQCLKDLLVRYLGFPFWDVLVYPVQSISEAGERDHVEVIRMSPDDATLLSIPGQEPKLKGTGLHHFAAFFKRSYRENDYLWGRLDAAERLISLLIHRDHPSYVQWCRKAFAAILDEEEADLTEVRDLVSMLRSRVNNLTKQSGPSDGS